MLVAAGNEFLKYDLTASLLFRNGSSSDLESHLSAIISIGRLYLGNVMQTLFVRDKKVIDKGNNEQLIVTMFIDSIPPVSISKTIEEFPCSLFECMIARENG